MCKGYTACTFCVDCVQRMRRRRLEDTNDVAKLRSLGLSAGLLYLGGFGLAELASSGCSAFVLAEACGVQERELVALGFEAHTEVPLAVAFAHLAAEDLAPVTKRKAIGSNRPRHSQELIDGCCPLLARCHWLLLAVASGGS